MKPIPFSGPMIHALLDGKTQTRRVASLPAEAIVTRLSERLWQYEMPNLTIPDCQLIECPYGAIGDQLWVSEAWYIDRRFDKQKHLPVPPSSATPVVFYAADKLLRPADFGIYRNARSMPRWASRFTLRVEHVDIQKIQAITWVDCQAEGIRVTDVGLGHNEMEVKPTNAYINAFRKMWETTNGIGNWTANPWVWALTFTLRS